MVQCIIVYYLIVAVDCIQRKMHLLVQEVCMILRQDLELKTNACNFCLKVDVLLHHRKFFWFNLVLKLKVYDFRVLIGHTTRCIVQLVLRFARCTRLFFNTTHQVKAITIAIGIIKVHPLVEIGDRSFPLFLHVSCT